MRRPLRVRARLGPWLVLLLVGTLSDAAPARAFSIERPLAEGCHEHITASAIGRAPFGRDLPTVPADHAHRRLASAVPFTVPDVARGDPRVLALLIGVRASDTGELAVTDLDRLAAMHGDPSNQPADCLRGPDDDYAAGDASAIAACRARILDEIDAALGAGDVLDSGTEDVRMSLAFEGTRTVTLPRFPYRMGRALHTLQDSFSHAYRDESAVHVLTVHNWIDWVTGRYDLARDGVRHQGDRDRCTGSAAAMARATHAEDASVELLLAVADDTGGREGRRARAALVLDHWMTFLPGCDATNAWCGSPDALPTQSGCAVVAGGSRSHALLVVVALAVWASMRRRRREALLALLLALGPSASARAQDAPSTAETVAPTDPVATPRGAWGASATIAGALESPSAAISLGARWFPSDEWRIGLDVEWSPWFSLGADRAALGVLDAYASLGCDWARLPGVRIGTRIAAGISVLLFDEYGASAGDAGPMLAATLIGVGFELDREWELRIDPEAFIAVPHLPGTPQVFRAYRVALSLVWRP